MLTIELFGSYGARLRGSNLEVDMNSSKRPKDPIGPLCRLLRDSFSPHQKVRVVRGETLCFPPRPIRDWADYDVVDTQELVAYRKKFTPFKPFK